VPATRANEQHAKQARQKSRALTFEVIVAFFGYFTVRDKSQPHPSQALIRKDSLAFSNASR
jgi:hypothetical protein